MFMPAYNEQKIICDNALCASRALRDVCGALGISGRLVVLDDGSNDATAAEVNRAMEQDGSIGYQWAPGPSRRENLIRAMLAADTRYVGWMDADLATSLDDLHELVSMSVRYDIVTGSRYLPSSVAERTLHRMLISRGYNGLVRLLFGSRIRDHWCGFKVFDRAALTAITEHIGVGITGRKMFWDAQMWVCAQRLGLRILELPVQWREGEKTSLRVYTELPMMHYTFLYWASGKWRRIDSIAKPGPAKRPTVVSPERLG
jgi:glycosyltransferase involved in cell wall biosynthesis